MDNNISPILLDKISWGAINLQFKEPIKVTPYTDKPYGGSCIRCKYDRVLIAENPVIDLFVFAYTREELIVDINEQIVMMWLEYALAKPEDLTKDTQELRLNLLEALEEVKLVS